VAYSPGGAVEAVQRGPPQHQHKGAGQHIPYHLLHVAGYAAQVPCQALTRDSDCGHAFDDYLRLQRHDALLLIPCWVAHAARLAVSWRDFGRCVFCYHRMGLLSYVGWLGCVLLEAFWQRFEHSCLLPVLEKLAAAASAATTYTVLASVVS
jgi:hypothetical protein